MEYTIRSPKGFNYTLLKPGSAEGSELAMHGLRRHGAGSTGRVLALYTHPLLLATRAKVDGRRVRRRSATIFAKTSAEIAAKPRAAKARDAKTRAEDE